MRSLVLENILAQCTGCPSEIISLIVSYLSSSGEFLRSVKIADMLYPTNPRAPINITTTPNGLVLVLYENEHENEDKGNENHGNLQIYDSEMNYLYSLSLAKFMVCCQVLVDSQNRIYLNVGDEFIYVYKWNHKHRSVTLSRKIPVPPSKAYALDSHDNLWHVRDPHSTNKCTDACTDNSTSICEHSWETRVFDKNHVRQRTLCRGFYEGKVVDLAIESLKIHCGDIPYMRIDQRDNIYYHYPYHNYGSPNRIFIKDKFGKDLEPITFEPRSPGYVDQRAICLGLEGSHFNPVLYFTMDNFVHCYDVERRTELFSWQVGTTETVGRNDLNSLDVALNGRVYVLTETDVFIYH